MRIRRQTISVHITAPDQRMVWFGTYHRFTRRGARSTAGALIIEHTHRADVSVTIEQWSRHRPFIWEWYPRSPYQQMLFEQKDGTS